MANEQTGTTALQLALAWGFVGIPLAWGVIQTLHQRDEAVSVRSGSKMPTARPKRPRRFYLRISQ